MFYHRGAYASIILRGSIILLIAGHYLTHKSTRDGIKSTYLFFYNLSPNLPINLNVLHVIGVTPSHLKIRKRLFWRGDVVATKVQPESEQRDFIIESLDADISELRPLEEFLRATYQKGGLERNLHYDELEWDSYLEWHFRGPTSSLLGAPKSYWGTNAAEKEENFLHDLNELRCAIGRPPLPRPVHMKSYSERAVTLYTAFKSAFRLRRKVTGPTKLPPELERRIFETCALESPEVCTVLVLIARRVHVWIDPILIATVCIMEDFESKRWDRLECLLAKLANGKPVEYYAQNIKNLAILGFFQIEAINRILAICTGVENLVLSASARGFVDFFENPQAGRNLRRLSINLGAVSPQFGSGMRTMTGPPEQVMQLMQTLPTVRYVALGHYCGGERYKYADAAINNSPHIREAWDVRVVFLSDIPQYDWERGARGKGDFWNLVEREVERRLEDGILIISLGGWREMIMFFHHRYPHSESQCSAYIGSANISGGGNPFNILSATFGFIGDGLFIEFQRSLTVFIDNVKKLVPGPIMMLQLFSGVLHPDPVDRSSTTRRGRV
ncbi:hypothetical protein JOM56_003045 [Amanita muscaria]